MSQELVLASQPREPKTSKGLLKTNRYEGRIPAVIYGVTNETQGLWVSRIELEKAMRQAHSSNVLFQLQIQDAQDAEKSKNKAKIEHVLLKEIQRSPTTEAPVHVDFLRVDLKKRVEVNIPLRVTGESTGVKNQGGILELLSREIKVRCLPTAIPESVVIDVTPLGIGQGVFVKDLNIPADVEVLTDGNHLVVTVATPAKEEEVAAAAPAAGSAEPEVIAKGKKDAEGAEGAAAAKPAAGAAPAKAEAPAKK